MNKALVIASCILGMSIISGALIISRGFPNHCEVRSAYDVSLILTEKELTVYLHITPGDLQKIISDDQLKEKELLSKNGSWDTYQFYPMLRSVGRKSS